MAESITWERDWDQAFARARAERKPVLIDVEKEHWIGCELLDAVVYPVATVIAAVEERFVALRLDHKDPRVRDLHVAWLPTILIADRRGVVHERNVNSVPPAEFLDLLDLGEAKVRLREADFETAVARIDAALARRPDGPLHPELLFWLGIAAYNQGGHDGEARDEVWADLMARYPGSIWALRVPDAMADGAPPPPGAAPSS